MTQIKSLADLKKKKDETSGGLGNREKGAKADTLVQVKVAMATCGIASGAKEVYEYFNQELSKRNIEGVVTQTGCMGYCYAEPTVEIKLPGKDPIVYGEVNCEKADMIIEKYIKNNVLVDGIIPVNYRTIE